MKRLLITYTSHSGSTKEIAQFLCEEFSAEGFVIDSQEVSKKLDLSPYEFIVAGGLLYRFGWHPDIVNFLKENQAGLQMKQVALFVTGMHVIKTPQCDQQPYPVFLDPAISNPSWARRRSTLFDGGSTMDGYLKRALPTITKIKPISLAFFAGRLDLHTLKLPEQAIMVLLMLLTGMKPGDYRNWEAIRAWAQSLDLFSQPIRG